MSRTVPFGTFTTRKDLHAKGARTAKRSIGKLVGSVYEPKARAKGLGFHWSHQPRHAYKSACITFNGPFAD